MRKKKFILAPAGLALLLLPAALPVFSQAPGGPREIVVVVNGEAIRREDLEREVVLMEQQLRRAEGEAPGEAAPQLEARALESLIDQALLYQESLARGYRIDPAELQRDYETFRGRFADQELFEGILGQLKHTPESFRRKLERNLTVQRLVAAEIAPTVEITEEEARFFYEEHADLFRLPEGRLGFAEARPGIEEHLLQARISEEVGRWLQRLRSRALIERLPPARA